MTEGNPILATDAGLEALYRQVKRFSLLNKIVQLFTEKDHYMCLSTINPTFLGNHTYNGV